MKYNISNKDIFISRTFKVIYKPTTNKRPIIIEHIKYSEMMYMINRILKTYHI